MKLVSAVAALAAACLAAAFAGTSQAATNTYCIGGSTVRAGSQTANMNGTPVTAAYLFSYEVANGGIIDVLASESPTLHMDTYEEELSYPDTVTNPDGTTYTYVDEPISAGACARGSGGAGAAAAPAPSSDFLCFSSFETNPGTWVASEAATLLQSGGYWSPYAIAGNVSGGTNIGGYHLVCNLATGQAASQQLVTDDGYVAGTDDYNALKSTPGWYPVVP